MYLYSRVSCFYDEYWWDLFLFRPSVVVLPQVQSSQAAAMAPPSGRSITDSSAAPKPEQHSSSSAEESFKWVQCVLG